LKSIFDLSASLGFATVVEGIETDEEKAWFSQSGCTSFQGFLFSRPLAADDFVTYYIQNEQLHAPLTAALDEMKKINAPARRTQSGPVAV
jgi:sensor c-di-GMP phosphodiesterase-like protein